MAPQKLTLPLPSNVGRQLGTKQEIFSKVQQCLARVFEINSSEVTLQSSIDNTPNWDSLGHLRLIMDLEAEFGISFSTEDIPTLVTVDIICDSLEEYRA